MAQRQFRVKTPEHTSVHDRVAWAMRELNVLVSASASLDDVVTQGMAVPKGADGAFGGIYVRRGWLYGMSVSASSREAMGNVVEVTVTPTSKLQSSIMTVAFLSMVSIGSIGGCAFGGIDQLMLAVVGLFFGAVVGIFLVVGLQRLGLAVTKDASVAVDAVAADVQHWAEQHTA